MELTYLTDYSLRVLMYTGVHGGRRVTMREIAGAYDVSLEHLRKVVHRLAQHQYLDTARGQGGGIRLARSPDSIRVGEVVDIMEPSRAIVDCERQPCPLCGNCTLKSALDDARAAFIERLDRYTLADLIGRRRTLRRIRMLEPTA